MSLFEIDQTKCKRDKFCVSVCPMGIIEMKTRESFPSAVNGADELCIKCGHCVAVCPHEAFALNSLRPVDCQPTSASLSPSYEQVAYLMKSRRSIRRYKDVTVDGAIINDLIEVASYAPSGHNSQPVHWLVVQDRQDMKALAAIVIDWMKSMVQNQPEFAKTMHFNRVIAAWDMGQDKVLRDAPHMIIAHG
ncbi:MAG: nitroreductase family protein, partial [Desulfomonilaceae bacterium]